MNITLLIILVIVLIVLYKCKENYSPIITRYSQTQCPGNSCIIPATNNKKNELCNKKVSTYQYADRFIKTPDNYLHMVSNLLNYLSKKSININDLKLNTKDFNGDTEYITNFMNSKIDDLIKNKDYLQQNGPWKYEKFYTCEPTIYYFSTDKNNLNIFKIIYTLANPLRSSYTSCIAFISEKGELSGNLEIIYTEILNDTENKSDKNNLQSLSKDALHFSFLGSLADIDTNKFGESTNSSGLNYISDYGDSEKINIKADIPIEFKKNTFEVQRMPPLFGNGVVDYP